MISIVGCGFVGSIFLDEYLKRAFAGHIPHGIRLIDFDTVDDRNPANQNFLVSDKGKAKAEVLADRVRLAALRAEAIVERLTLENAEEMLKNSLLVIDGVDNLATRQLLWAHAHAQGVPVLHIGISEMGTGKVEWSHPEHDTFSLSPKRLGAKVVRDPESGVVPPCDLARMRGVGINIGFAAAKAAAIFFGVDPESHLDGQWSARYLTEWAASPLAHEPVSETWGQIS